jgi:5'-nucleotidase
VIKRKDHRGKPYFWVGGEYKGFHNEPGTDCTLVNKNFATITPLRLDCTNTDFLFDLGEQWGTHE